MIVTPDKVSFTPVCCRSSFQAVRQQGAQSCRSSFPIAVSQPNPGFSNRTATKRPLATSPYRPQAEIRSRLIADIRTSALTGNLEGIRTYEICVEGTSSVNYATSKISKELFMTACQNVRPGDWLKCTGCGRTVEVTTQLAKRLCSSGVSDENVSFHVFELTRFRCTICGSRSPSLIVKQDTATRVPHSVGNNWEDRLREKLIAEGKLTPEHNKPEWLRGIGGGGPPRMAMIGPADKDGNPFTPD